MVRAALLWQRARPLFSDKSFAIHTGLNLDLAPVFEHTAVCLPPVECRGSAEQVSVELPLGIMLMTDRI